MSPLSAGITAHSTFGTVNLPTRTDGMTSRFASTTVLSAVVNFTLPSVGLNFNPRRLASFAEMVVRPCRVENHLCRDLAETGVNVEHAVLAVQIRSFRSHRSLDFHE